MPLYQIYVRTEIPARVHHNVGPGPDHAVTEEVVPATVSLDIRGFGEGADLTAALADARSQGIIDGVPDDQVVLMSRGPGVV